MYLSLASLLAGRTPGMDPDLLAEPDLLHDDEIDDLSTIHSVGLAVLQAEATVHAVACPRCWSKVGEPCSGDRMPSEPVHMARLDKFLGGLR